MAGIEAGEVARPHRVGVIDVRVGAEAEQVPLLRSFAVDIAMRMDFDLDRIEDLRMTVDEACSLLVRAALPAASLYCSFTPEAKAIRVNVSVDARSAETPSSDPMGWQILTALADSVKEHVESTADGHRISIELVALAGGAAEPR
ncbi:MAG TPA: anti-sigma factor [Pseudonocardiaceae bacterium]|nr:anti-sigma factor [Pseudonocardiaceae bacterium]